MKNTRLVAVRFARQVLAGAVGLLLPTMALAQGIDTTPPQLRSFTFAPASIDVSGGAKTVSVTLGITDDLAGVSAECCPVQIRFRSPSGGQFRDGSGVFASGTPLNGTWAAAIVFPQFSEAGTWTVEYVSLVDLVGNTAYLQASDLQALSFPTTLEVVSVTDVAAPHLAAFNFVPVSVDTSTSPQSVTVTLGVDDVTGVGPACCPVQFRFRSPSGGQIRYGSGVFSSGTPSSGTWEATVVFPQFSEAGTWTVDYVSLVDVVGNTAYLRATDLQASGFPIELEVVSNPSDSGPPQLTGFAFTPTLIDTSASTRAVTIDLGVTDDVAGVGPACCPVQFRFRSPSGGQIRYGSGVFSSGTPLSGTWEATVVFPQFSEAGTWTVDYVSLVDVVGNTAYLRASDLQALGFPTDLVVIRPSLVSDGTVSDPVAGGTVIDDTFGARAQVTFPPGVLSDVTDVAIDVFEQPLDVAIPHGFVGAGTRFVNIALVPEPVFPLPAPGVTVVLPLVSFQSPGTSLALYRVETATGLLVPALDWAGLPVVGTVDAPGGLSATFAGIGQLSTVVGLLPAVTIVTIDIKPGDTQNAINLSSKGVVPVAILTTAAFDAAAVDPFSVTLAGASVRLHGKTGTAGSLEDVDGDGDLDLVVHVEAAQLVLTSEDTEAVLNGQTIDGVAIEGRDRVRIVPRTAGKAK